ncbi:MAG: hypothetical protein ACTHOO_02225 [Alcanivorax sp.]
MAKRAYYPSALRLQHKDVVKLHESGDLDIMLDRHVYTNQFAKSVPVTHMFRNTVTFWRNATWIIFLLSTVLLVVLSAWYWLVMGVLIGGFLAMTHNNMQIEEDQLMEQTIVAVMINDKDYYDRFLTEQESGWHYMITPDKADPFLNGEKPEAKPEAKPNDAAEQDELKAKEEEPEEKPEVKADKKPAPKKKKPAKKKKPKAKKSASD